MSLHQAGYEFAYGIKEAWALAENTFADYATRAGMIASAYLVQYDQTPQAGVFTNDLYTITGGVELLSFWGIFYFTRQMASVMKVWFDVYDQTISVPITANGVDCSDVPDDSYIGRQDTAGNAAALYKSDQCRIYDSAAGVGVSAPLIVRSKFGVETVLRMHYTNDGSPIYFAMYFNAVWRSLVRDSGRIVGDWF